MMSDDDIISDMDGLTDAELLEYCAVVWWRPLPLSGRLRSLRPVCVWEIKGHSTRFKVHTYLTL